MIRASLVIWRSDFVISFAWLPIGNFAIAGVDFQIAKVRRKKYASPHLVYLRWLHRGMRGQGAHAFASIDHLDSRAWYSRLDHRRRRNPPVLSAKCRRQISSRRINCFNRWGDSSLIHLAQVQTAAPSRITNRFGTEISVVRTDRRTFLGAPLPRRVGYGRSLPIFISEIDLDQFDSRLGLRSLALSKM